MKRLIILPIMLLAAAVAASMWLAYDLGEIFSEDMYD